MSPKLTCLSPQRDFSLWCQAGCLVSVGRTGLAAQQHVPELSPSGHPFPGSWEKDILSLRRKQPLSPEGESLHKSLFAKASWPFLAPAGCSPLTTSLLLHRGGRGSTDLPSLPPQAQPCTPNPQKPSIEMSLFRKEKQQHEC